MVAKSRLQQGHYVLRGVNVTPWDCAGLLPPHIQTMERTGVMRVMTNFHSKPNDLERYVQLVKSLQDRNETLFYRVVMEHLEEMLPICLHAHRRARLPGIRLGIFRRSRGFYVFPAGTRAGSNKFCATGRPATCG